MGVTPPGASATGHSLLSHRVRLCIWEHESNLTPSHPCSANIRTDPLITFSAIASSKEFSAHPQLLRYHPGDTLEVKQRQSMTSS